MEALDAFICCTAPFFLPLPPKQMDMNQFFLPFVSRPAKWATIDDACRIVPFLSWPVPCWRSAKYLNMSCTFSRLVLLIVALCTALK